ncbi:MAG: hypothetical protein ACWGO1_08205, partial [Anaerolineales bacterium]
MNRVHRSGSTCTRFSRRDFLKLGGLGVISLLPHPGKFFIPRSDPPLPVPIGRARVTTSAIYVYDQPDFNSQRLGMLRRDELVTIYGELFSEQAPAHNRRWYQLLDGYAYSAYLQRVDHAYPNPQILENIPENGCLGEITVPYTDSLRRISSKSWQPLYRLYYQSVLWIT